MPLHPLERIHQDLSIRVKDAFHDIGHWSFNPKLHTASLRRNRDTPSRSLNEQNEKRNKRMMELLEGC